jgi:hypothetical protein
MPAIVVTKPHEVANELERIGLSSEQVLEIVHAMAGAKADATENDPPGAAGWSAWRMGIRRSREVTVHDVRFPDWERDETGQVSSVVNRKIGVRLLVSNTDDGTGIDADDRFPQNRSKKGAATDRIVQCNQGAFEFMEQASNVVAFPKAADDAQGVTSWYVCVYADGEELRAELSCPVGIEGGFFTGFSKRIIILGGDGTGIDPIKRNKPDGEIVEFDIPVSRK